MKPKTRKLRVRKAHAEDAKVRVKAKNMKSPKEAGEFVVPVYNAAGKEVDKFAFDKKIFNGRVLTDILYQAVLMYNANKRQGNASTKTRGDVSGGGKKPWRQKGTGRARAGSTRSPLWRHGGTIFGPHTRDFHYDIPKKVKRLAFLSSINSKLNEKKIVGINSFVIDEPKTKKVRGILEALKLKGKSLFVLDEANANILRASKNLKEVFLRNYKDFNTMDVLTCDNLVLSKTALEKLPERFRD